jgi:NADPH-dependent glutamate synthase beta subunit-like oxidoreductase/glutamate synthase domain-containing protein 3/Pyruvate/2-oxoacid:ferredoxin oxidoreductase delta subunit
MPSALMMSPLPSDYKLNISADFPAKLKTVDVRSRSNKVNPPRKPGRTITVKGIDKQDRRISSKEFEEVVQAASKKSKKLILETFGQHNVGGRLMPANGPYNLTIRGPVGQRLGCMGQPGTVITCEGPASDDVGYLNIGAHITVMGDATNGTCNAMAQGKVMVRGSIGARGLTMTKWNPDYPRPELWVLGSVGDTFAEFNCGGIGVICGIEPKNPKNVLGYRPCVGMVGGWIYYRGETDDTYSRTNVKLIEPDDDQWQWLMNNLPGYLEKIGKKKLLKTLSVRKEWHLLQAITPQERALIFSGPMPMAEFRSKVWDKAFGGDPLRDLAPGLDRSPIGLIESGDLRRRQPFWANHVSAAPCTFYCPVHIPTIDRLRLVREGKMEDAYQLVLQHTPFPGSVCGSICPNLCMEGCSRQTIDQSIDVAMLGRSIKDAPKPEEAEPVGKKVAIVGGGPAGMSAAWVLAQAGIEAHIFEKEDRLGGKLAQVIPWDRLPKATWDAEIDRFMQMKNIHVHFGATMTRSKFTELTRKYDYVIVAVGTHEPRRLPFPGKERVVAALDFLKAAKSDRPMKVGRQVVIIGAGNVGCDVACEAYRLGAEEVTLVDIQKPLAFGKEKEAAEALGATFRWPVMTGEVTAQGLVTTEGELIPAQTVIISIGDIPALSFLPKTVECITVGGAAWIKTDEAGLTSDRKIFAIGDVERPGLATNALGGGKKAADYIIAEARGEKWQPMRKKVIDLKNLTLEHYCPEPAADTPEAEADRCLSCGKCRDCHLCETICPTNAISRREVPTEVGYEYIADDGKCIACGFCRDTCPCGIWVMQPFE